MTQECIMTKQNQLNKEPKYVLGGECHEERANDRASFILYRAYFHNLAHFPFTTSER